MKKQQLLAFTVKAEGSRMDLDVYEAIGESFWGDSVSAKDVLSKIRAQKPAEIYMRVNSGGGDLFDGIAIANLLKASGAKIYVSIDGVAASAATHLWPVGAQVTMASNAVLMIHKAWSMAVGNATEMTKLADTLSKADELQARNYAEQATSRGVLIDAARFSALMSEETWMTAEEALAHGLIDSIGEAVSVAASVDVSAFRRPPTELVGRVAAAKAFTSPTDSTVSPVAAPTSAPTTAPKEQDMTVELQAALEAHQAELVALKAEHTQAIAAFKADADAFRLRAEKAESEARTARSEANATKVENDRLNAEKAIDHGVIAQLRIEKQAFASQVDAIAAERDKALSDIAARDAKLLESEVDALIPNVLDPAERDNFIALAKTSRTLFDSMVAQRKPRSLTAKIVNTDIPPAEANAAVGADAKFDDLVSKDLT